MVRTVEFYVRGAMRIKDRIVAAMVADDLARQGYLVDRLADITAQRYSACWRYDIPVVQVTR